MKKPKFLLAENPMAAPGVLYILHTKQPQMLISVAIFDIGNELAINELKKQLPFAGALEYGIEYYIFYPVEIYSEITVPDGDEQQTADKLAKLMRRVADWYEAYLIYEDNYDPKED